MVVFWSLHSWFSAEVTPFDRRKWPGDPITGWKMAPSMYLPYFPILCWTFGHVTSIVTVPKCSNDQQIPWLEIRRIPLLTLKTTWLLWLQFWRNLSLGIHVFFCTGHFNKLKHAVRFWIYCDSIKWDLPATLQGSAPYIVVFWPSRRNIPRRARLRQWVDGSLRFSVFGYCKLMDMFFLRRLPFWEKMIWPQSMTCFPLGWNHHLGCVLYKSSCDQASYVNEIESRSMSGDITVLVLRMKLRISSQWLTVNKVLHKVIW